MICDASIPQCLIDARTRGEQAANVHLPIWDRTEYGYYRRTARFAGLRRQVWASMRAEGWSLCDIARATNAKYHTTIIWALKRSQKA